jgi:hypothetical protein
MKSRATFVRNHKSEMSIGNNTSFHSDIKRGVTENGVIYLCKRYGQKVNGFDLTQAKVIATHMNSFRRLANQIHLSIAPVFQMQYEPYNNAGRVSLLEIQPYLGRDLQVVFADSEVSDYQARKYIDDYLSLFRRVKENGSFVSLDPTPANFCVNEFAGKDENALIYVDMMPPRYRGNENVISEWPDPPVCARSFIYRRYFGLEQSRVIYAHLLHALTGRLGIPCEEIKDRIKEKLGEQAYRIISFNSRDKNRALEEPEKYGPDVLRIIAAEGYRCGLYKIDQFFRVFTAMHITAGGLLPSSKDMQKAACELQKSFV